MTLAIRERRQRPLFGRVAVALIVAVVVNLLIFTFIAHLLDQPLPATLPPLISLSRQDPPQTAMPIPSPPPRASQAVPPKPPSLPTLDLGALASDHPYTQPDRPVIAPLPTLAPNLSDAVVEGSGPGQALAATGVLDQGQLDEGVQALNRHEPEFPARAQRLGLTDTATVSFIVHADGSVTDVALVEARHPEYFSEPSLACVRSTRFSPGRKDGHPVSTRCLWTFHYVLPAQR